MEHISLYLLTGLVAVMLICLTVVACVVYFKDGQTMRQTVNKLAQDEFALRLCTVFIIVFLTAFLTLADVMNELVATLFSGIAGYVLGGIGKKRNGDSIS